MDPPHRTGVFYQAMPAIGADGKNIMKLIPVQMVNGRFFKTPVTEHKTDPTPQKDVTNAAASALSLMAKKAAFGLSASQQMIKKQVSFLNGFPNQEDSILHHSVNKQPLQQKPVRSMAKVLQIAAPSPHLGTSVSLPYQLPVTVKSPALPRGQCLQIPPTAQVQRVPASQLPPGVKEQIFTSSASSSAGSHSVVYVSPVTTLDQGVPEPSGPAPDTVKLLSKTSNTTSRGLPPRGAKPQLKLIPKVSQRPNSPTRWVIEEVDSSAPSAVSESAQWSRRNDATGQENALVVCNGKVFFVANKCGSSFKSTAATECSEINKIVVPGSAAPQTKQNLRTPGESSEVIDLCDDDDAQEDFPHLDEDNVIFVSYIPPKPESGPAPQSMLETQLELVEQTERTASSSSNSRTDASAQRRGQSPSEKQDTRDGGSGVESQRSTSNQPVDSMEVEAETSPAGCGCRGEHAQKQESSTHPLSMRTSPPAPEPRQRSDHLLRQIFGITADVKISLLKIDEAAAGCVSAGLIRSAGDDGKPTSGLKEKELSSQDIYGPKEPDGHSGLVSVQSVKVLSEREQFASPLTNVTPLKSSHFKLNSEPPSASKNCCSGQSALSRTCRAEPEPVIGYVEPIDEDFPDENDIPESQDAAAHPQAPTCEDMSSNTSRLGRTRKRTMCPCCIPAALHPVVKSSGRWEEPERWTLTTEQTGKKAGRTKTARKDGRTPGRISCLAPAGDGLSSTSSDYDELKGHEQMERLADLLNEKDAQIRHTVS
ncbi:uncharacterized protein lrif1 isoform X2 [Leuresthes tenuis]|uniref:uncharacterized protein lrif1 isoform X2 n=1 Tax=Leuresthes tenuis TaxID=355514 RepID=UPI003B50D179